MNKKIAALTQRKSDKLAEAKSILAAAGDAELSEEQQSTYDALMTDIDGVNASIKREERIAAEEASIPAASATPAGPAVIDSENRVKHDDRGGFKSYGEFAAKVADVTMNHSIDQRLMAGAPSTYGNESVGADGGFLIPPEFSSEIWGMSLEQDSFLPMTDNMNISGNSMVFPSDETTPWGTDGVRAYWEDEAAAATATKPSLKPNTMRLNKLTALVPVSDELMADASGLAAYLQRKTGESIRYKTNDAIINGDGVGKPLGIFNAGGLVSQAKVTSQTADTINATNVVNMFSRNINPGRGVWLINPDAYPQLPLATIGDQPVWIPNNSLASATGGTLQGRPVYMTDTCQTLGDKGDIYFVDFGSYRTLTKAGGIETATSMHLYFDASAMAFRAVFRIAGQPILGSAVTPPNSTVTRSAYVTLDARA